MKTYKKILREVGEPKYDPQSTVDTRTNEDAYLEILQNYCLNPDTKNQWAISKISVGDKKGKTALSKQTQNAQGGTESITYIFGEGDFRKELAGYASENELTNLKAAYKAFKYEEAKKNKALAAKTVEKAKAKKATNVVSRAGAGEGSPVADTTDLNAVIRAAMKEASAQ